MPPSLTTQRRRAKGARQRTADTDIRTPWAYKHCDAHTCAEITLHGARSVAHHEIRHGALDN
eukprot:899663-Prymnesium_polylepis.1